MALRASSSSGTGGAKSPTLKVKGFSPVMPPHVRRVSGKRGRRRSPSSSFRAFSSSGVSCSSWKVT